jgi:transposase-like protein
MKKDRTDAREWAERKKHVEEARRYSGGLAAYCQQAGITVNALSYWRKKLRNQSAVPASAFVPVQVLAAESPVRSPELPDAKWLADLIRGLVADSSRSPR